MIRWTTLWMMNYGNNEATGSETFQTWLARVHSGETITTSPDLYGRFYEWSKGAGYIAPPPPSP